MYGLTIHAKGFITERNIVSAWKLLTYELILRHLQDSTEAKARQVLTDKHWPMPVEEMRPCLSS